MTGKRKGIVNDYVRGADTFAHTGRMLFYSILTTLLISVVVAFSVSSVFFWRQTTPDQRSWGWAILKAEFWDTALKMHTQAIILPSGEKFQARQFLAAPNIKTFRGQMITVVIQTSRTGAWGGVSVFILIAIVAIWRGVKLRKDEFLRGGTLAEPAELARDLRRKKEASDILIGDVPMTNNAELQHLLITGAPGVGKSVLISSILDRVQKKGQRAIVYDRSGDYVRQFYDPNRGDVILNPTDSRCPRWTPWAEISSITDYDRIASTLIPEAQSSDPFWVEAARSLIAALLLNMHLKKDHSVANLLQLALRDDLKVLAQAVAGTDAAALIGSEDNAKMALSVRATMTTYLRSLRLLPHRPDAPAFSVKNWVKNENQKGWLFLTSRADQHDAIKPLLTTWLDSASSSILSLPPDRKRRIWMILDELPSLHKLPSISTSLAEGRKYGLCGVLGIQSVAQLREIYKKDGAEALLGLASTQCHFRAADPDTADWGSRALYEADKNESKEDLSYSASDAKDGVRLTDSRQTRRLVLPTELMSLPDLTAYIRLLGDYPISKTKLKFKSRPAKAAGFLPADEELSVGGSMMSAPAQASAQALAPDPAPAQPEPKPAQPEQEGCAI